MLKPPQASSTDPLEMIIASVAPPHACYNDNDSLSASDDEDDFFLAAPSVINEEKKACLQNVKQRKIEFACEMPPRRLPSGVSLRSGLASNASLLGMDFVTSSSNLQNMDRAHSNVFPQASFDEFPGLQQPDLTETVLPPREEHSPPSLGLALDSGRSYGVHQLVHQAGDRELKTPPIADAAPGSPPPLHATEGVSFM